MFNGEACRSGSQICWPSDCCCLRGVGVICSPEHNRNVIAAGHVRLAGHVYDARETIANASNCE